MNKRHGLIYSLLVSYLVLILNLGQAFCFVFVVFVLFGLTLWVCGSIRSQHPGEGLNDGLQFIA